MKIVISNIYSPRNIGDRAIIEGITHFFKGQDPTAEFVLLSKFHIELSVYNNWVVGKELVDCPLSRGVFRQVLSSALDVVRFFGLLLTSKVLGQAVTRRLPRDDPFRVITESNIVAVAGGGYLFSSNKSMISRTMLIHLLNIYLPTLMGKRVIVFPQTVGPFNRKFDSWIVRKILSKVDFVMLRDEPSFNLIRSSIRDGRGIALVSDIAFVLGGPPFSEPAVSIKNVIVTVLDWTWGVETSRLGEYAATKRRYINRMVEAINYLTESMGCEVVLFVQVTAAESDDSILSREIAELTDGVVDVHTIGMVSMDEVLRFYSNFDLVIGSRMHSCIFGIAQGIPTIGIGYQPKTLGTFSLLGLHEYAINANNAEIDLLQQRIEYIRSNYESVARCFRSKSQYAKDQIDIVAREVFSDGDRIRSL